MQQDFIAENAFYLAIPVAKCDGHHETLQAIQSHVHVLIDLSPNAMSTLRSV